MAKTSFRFDCHVQEIAENTVDVGHFAPTHGYDGVVEVSPLETGPNLLRSRYALGRSANIFGRPTQRYRSDLTIHLHGLGLYVIDGEIEPGGLSIRNVFCATPIDERTVELRAGLWLRGERDVSEMNRVLGWIPRSVRRWLMMRMALIGLRNDVRQDTRILNRKRHEERPALADGDGCFRQFRDWARQFYAPPADVATAAPDAKTSASCPPADVGRSPGRRLRVLQGA